MDEDQRAGSSKIGKCSSGACQPPELPSRSKRIGMAEWPQTGSLQSTQGPGDWTIGDIGSQITRKSRDSSNCEQQASERSTLSDLMEGGEECFEGEESSLEQIQRIDDSDNSSSNYLNSEENSKKKQSEASPEKEKSIEQCEDLIDQEKSSLVNKRYREKQGPKMDDHEKTQMMGFIAYAHNIENTVKLLSFSKLISLNEPHDKNRIFVTGQKIMSTNLVSTSSAITKALDHLESQEIRKDKVKRANFLDRHSRVGILKKMKESL